MPPPLYIFCVPARMLFVITLFMIVGELITKMPPPATWVGVAGGTGYGSPAPPVSVKPSRCVEGLWPDGKTTTLHWLPVRLAQKFESVQGLPAALIVVTAAPPCDSTLTPGRIRIDSG